MPGSWPCARASARGAAGLATAHIAMEALIARFGLIVIFLGAGLEGDLVLVLGGVTAHLGLVDLPLAIGVGAAGCLTGDLIYYAIGRSRSAAIQRGRVYKKVGPAVERLAARLGHWQIPAARAIYGTRVATMLFWGVHKLSLEKFLVADALGCAVWAALLGTVGYAASNGATVVLGEVKRAELWLLGAACVGVVALVSTRLLMSRLRVRPLHVADQES